jgi:hypothetical protein
MPCMDTIGHIMEYVQAKNATFSCEKNYGIRNQLQNDLKMGPNTEQNSFL